MKHVHCIHKSTPRLLYALMKISSFKATIGASMLALALFAVTARAQTTYTFTSTGSSAAVVGNGSTVASGTY